MFGMNHTQQFTPYTAAGIGNGFTPYTPYVPYPQYGYGTYAPYGVAPYANLNGIPAYNGIQAGPMNSGNPMTSPELNLVLARVEEIRLQLALLNETIRLDHARRGLNGMNLAGGLAHNHLQTFGFNHAGATPIEGASPIRLRESDSHIFMDVYLPHLAMGDVDVEVSGNRIVCRTRVPVGPISRIWANAPIPRGFELYELADGRVEFSWIAPVTFQAKEVEATWREGFLCVCIPKLEVTPRHSVKVVRETVSNRKTADGMNS